MVADLSPQQLMPTAATATTSLDPVHSASAMKDLELQSLQHATASPSAFPSGLLQAVQQQQQQPGELLMAASGSTSDPSLIRATVSNERPDVADLNSRLPDTSGTVAAMSGVVLDANS